jgi:DNA-binding NtrC family response regulator
MMHALDRRPFKDMRRALIDEFERRYLHELLEQHRFDLTAVVRSARLSRKHLCALIQKHGLDRPLRARRSARSLGFCHDLGVSPQSGA